MGTHTMKFAFADELGSLTNVRRSAKFNVWKLCGRGTSPARIKQTGLRAKLTVGPLKTAVTLPPCETTPAVDDQSSFSVSPLKDDWISTSGPNGDSAAQKSSSWAALFCDTLEKKVMSWALGRDTTCKEEKLYSHLLSDNYAPVSEMAPTTDLPISGIIPACMNGIFLRNGPNPKFEPLRGYHWFDGDGMIHGLNIKDGKATYVARYVRTSKLQQEEHYGAPKFVKTGDLKGIPGYFLIAMEGLRVILGVLDYSHGVGTGNTSLVFHNNKLLALHEQDRPYSIKVLEDGDLQTISLETYEQKLNHPVTAHPRIDPITGEMFIFGYQLITPYLIYRVISKDGVVGEPVPITMSGPVMMHDFAISKNYAILMDLPLFVSFTEMTKGGFLLNFDPSKEARLGLLPRYATSGTQIRWFTIPSCFITHIANAWEEGDEVILTGCRRDGIDLSPSPEFTIEKALGFGSKLYEFRMNLKTGEVKHRQLSNIFTDFPRINAEYTGRKTCYAYCAIFDETDKVRGVAKYDLRMEPPQSANCRELEAGGNIAGVFHHGPGRAGGEAIFVPRKPGTDAPEDDGYLVSFVHDENTGKSEVVIIDAKTMAPEPVAVVSLPRRVPHGFHAHFVSQEQLRRQA